MNSIVLKAPAKVNLYLDVIRKRKDGYHDIVTIFEKIDIYDKIVISKKKKPGISISSSGGIPSKDNLAYKAACLLFSKLRLKQGIYIKIEKNIPIGSGLGGGSSDAAATLIGVNRLLRLGYKKKDLMHFAGRIGSDVPFFVTDLSFAIGKGRGDRIKGLPFRPKKLWHLVIFPGVKKLTKDVYGALKLDLTKEWRNVTMLLHALKTGKLDLIKRATYNRLEDPALDRDPGLSALKYNLIKSGMDEARLSGSGSSIFCITKTRKEAVLLKERILEKAGIAKREGLQVFISHTL